MDSDDSEFWSDYCEILGLCCDCFNTSSFRSTTTTTRPKVDMESLVVQNYIQNEIVVIFSKNHCPYSKTAKEVFDKLDQQYCTVELDQRNDGAEMQAILAQITGASTVPRVFVKGKCIGGGTDCKQLYESGELAVMLSA